MVVCRSTLGAGIVLSPWVEPSLNGMPHLSRAINKDALQRIKMWLSDLFIYSFISRLGQDCGHNSTWVATKWVVGQRVDDNDDVDVLIQICFLLTLPTDWLIVWQQPLHCSVIARICSQQIQETPVKRRRNQREGYLRSHHHFLTTHSSLLFRQAEHSHIQIKFKSLRPWLWSRWSSSCSWSFFSRWHWQLGTPPVIGT